MNVPTTIEAVRAGIEDAIGQAKSIAGALDEQQLNWQPAADAWSVGQCLEHLTVTARQYLCVLTPSVARAKPRPVPHPSHHRIALGLWGRLFVKTLTAPRLRLKAPGRFVPSSVASTDVLARFEQSHRDLIKLLAQVEELGAARATSRSPVSPFLRMNVGACFVVLVVHARRHIAQARRVSQNTSFAGVG